MLPTVLVPGFEKWPRFWLLARPRACGSSHPSPSCALRNARMRKCLHSVYRMLQNGIPALCSTVCSSWSKCLSVLSDSSDTCLKLTQQRSALINTTEPEFGRWWTVIGECPVQFLSDATPRLQRRVRIHTCRNESALSVTYCGEILFDARTSLNNQQPLRCASRGKHNRWTSSKLSLLAGR